jgi:RNA polymerase sigma-70 factor (ECF subfamily)
MDADDETNAGVLLDRAAGGDAQAWGALLARHQGRLERLAAFRLDPRLRGRVDAADVVQEVFIAATGRRAEFFQQSTQPLFLWLRWMVGNTLLELHRHHLGAQMRDARREMHPGRGPDGSAVSADENTRAALVARLTAGATGPMTAAGRAEVKARLDEALGRMDAADREVVALRHYEQLTSAEAAQVLGIQERAAAKRYLRALERLREILSDMPGGLTGLRP